MLLPAAGGRLAWKLAAVGLLLQCQCCSQVASSAAQRRTLTGMCKKAPNLRSSSAICRLNSLGTSPIVKRTSIPLSSYSLHSSPTLPQQSRPLPWPVPACAMGSSNNQLYAWQRCLIRGVRAPIYLPRRRWKPCLPRMKAPLLVLFVKASLCPRTLLSMLAQGPELHEPCTCAPHW